MRDRRKLCRPRASQPCIQDDQGLPTNRKYQSFAPKLQKSVQCQVISGSFPGRLVSWYPRVLGVSFKRGRATNSQVKIKSCGSPDHGSIYPTSTSIRTGQVYEVEGEVRLSCHTKLENWLRRIVTIHIVVFCPNSGGEDSAVSPRGLLKDRKRHPGRLTSPISIA